MRIGKLEKKILLSLLKSGAQTVMDLGINIEGVKISNYPKGHYRAKSFYRAIHNLEEKRLVATKSYLKYSKGFYGYMRNRFYAEGQWWLRYNGSGFYKEHTKPQGYGYFRRYGLTLEGRKRALEEKKRLTEFIDQWSGLTR